MLTDRQVRDGFHFTILQSSIYLSDSVASGIAEYITSCREQETSWVFRAQGEGFAVVDVLNKNMYLLALAPAKVGSYD